MKSDLLITFLNGLAVVAGVFFLNGMIARMHGLDVLGEFSYIRRIVTSCIKRCDQNRVRKELYTEPF